jgi:hypothetical protein
MERIDWRFSSGVLPPVVAHPAEKSSAAVNRINILYDFIFIALRE